MKILIALQIIILNFILSTTCYCQERKDIYGNKLNGLVQKVVISEEFINENGEWGKTEDFIIKFNRDGKIIYQNYFLINSDSNIIENENNFSIIFLEYSKNQILIHYKEFDVYNNLTDDIKFDENGKIIDELKNVFVNDSEGNWIIQTSFEIIRNYKTINLEYRKSYRNIFYFEN